eukprot:721302-Prorocentrum_minimum.AAC.1
MAAWSPTHEQHADARAPSEQPLEDCLHPGHDTLGTANHQRRGSIHQRRGSTHQPRGQFTSGG